jgi:hypothetical protein
MLDVEKAAGRSANSMKEGMFTKLVEIEHILKDRDACTSSWHERADTL